MDAVIGKRRDTKPKPASRAAAEDAVRTLIACARRLDRR